MKSDQQAPEDRGHLVGIIFFILGLGTLLPWNFFMTATKYFENRLDTSEWSNGTVVTSREYYFTNWMTLLSQLPLLLFTLLNSFLYQRLSEKVRIGGSLVFILLLFILTAVLVTVAMEKDTFFSVTMATIWFINSFGAVLQGSLFGLVGLLPQKYSAVFMSGQGLAGTFAAVAMLLAIYSEVDNRSAALGYFITPCVGTLITLMSYVLLPHIAYAQYYFNRFKRYEEEVNNVLLVNVTEMEPMETNKLNGHAKSNGTVEHGSVESAETKQVLHTLEQSKAQDARSSVTQVLKKIWVMAFCVTFVFTVTLSVFPAVTVDVQSAFKGRWQMYFTPVCCFLAFNIMDWFGRTITSVLQWPPKESRFFPALVVARVVFIPLLMMCNVQKRTNMPVLFPHDAVFVLIMVLFSVSSGYFVCLSMSYAPQLVEPKDAERAGALMTFFLALGLSLGAALSFPLRTLV
ncbi:equilibrative nucleoside transporter 2 [Scleropages formosus]|uniref:equilibrative nucleoside transporter 2 n=1 Tax=Scleropages formosus TaxID=113540 RepID=UPI0010FA821C|nr:equilibrative nucleoside transporter 2 [Scleropages formosus]